MNMPPKKKEPSLPIYCEACHILANSSSQAETHFKGHSHAKAVVKMQQGCQLPSNFSVDPNEATIKVIIMREDPTTLTMTSACALIPISFVKSKKKTVSMVHCKVCQLDFNSQQQAEQHFNGSKHLRMVGSSIEKKLPSETSHSQTSNSFTGGSLYTCDVCKVTLNSSSQFEQHTQGLKHRENLGETNFQGGGVKESGGWYYCNICDFSCSSVLELQQHLQTQAHKDSSIRRNTKKILN